MSHLFIEPIRNKEKYINIKKILLPIAEFLFNSYNRLIASEVLI
jgi:hypothetical protein